MPIDHRSVLSNIHRFDQLIKYLRDEMGWPISQDSFDDDDDLFYDFTTEELGIDMKNAAKIQRIQRLRPLSTHQPWGIFFIKFEPKHLPVVALRRILGQVAVKKRASANNPEQAAWSADDLLFVSNYGEGESRQISFAHFSQSEAKKDLPTLKVLGWDNFDTKLHLDHVADFLTEKLSWPEDEENQTEWRKNWSSVFTLTHKEVIITSKKLSKELAALARNIRDRIKTILAIETEDGPITKLMECFKKSLIDDLDEAGFADMYAQTIAYGLLSARITNPSGDSADDIIEAMPVTNPFLKELMETFLDVGGRKKSGNNLIRIDFDELGVSEIVELLDASNMEAVIRDFGDKNPQEDPVIHFFEGFLQEYDPKARKDRGVFYTPRPVVSFIVRSVDELLRTEFGLNDGLADTTTWGEMAGRIDDLEIPEGASPDQAFVQILDPATGTGTFLVEVIDLIHKTVTEKWQTETHDKKKIEKLWNDYVPEHLLPRLHGYELMMAPYAIAHMKIGLKLYETGYRFESEERARVYLTNALEPVQDFSGTLAFAIPALAHEVEAVNAIKRDLRVTVVIGNPPYSGESMNKGEWIRSLVDSYMYVEGSHLSEKGKKNWLQDDYVKFFRLAELTLKSSQTGILSYVSNHSFLDNPTFRGMRFSLLDSFRLINVLDLHGNTKKKEKSPDGYKDENVFDIQQGVSIGFFRNIPGTVNSNNVQHLHLWGLRGHAGKDTDSGKYGWLLGHDCSTTSWVALNPNAPFYLFIPQNKELRDEYDGYTKLTDAMPVYGAGIITARDHFIVDYDDTPLRQRLEQFRDETLSDDWIRENLKIKDNSMWSMSSARQTFQAKLIQDELFIDLLYRPYDKRRVYFETNVVFNMRMQIMRHLIDGDNLALVTTRQTKEPWSVLVANSIVAHKATALYDVSSVFPLYLKAREGELLSDESVANFAASILNHLEGDLKKATGPQENLSPEDMFHYVYALFHSPSYRSRYDEFLKIDFPRIPITAQHDLFIRLAELGSRLINLHLVKSPVLDECITSLIGSGRFEVEKVSYFDETVWIDKAKTCGFKGMPEEVWNFHIGGYQVCKKWLKDRGPKKGNPGRVLTDEDIEHYQKIVVALSETIRIMTEIDEVIDNHGGWPGAFQNN